MNTNLIRVLVAGLAFSSINSSMAMEGGWDQLGSNPQTSSTKINFADSCKIEINENGNLTIYDGDEILEFNDLNKPIFDSKTGETVIEYSGPAIDMNDQRSWAKATFDPNSHSPAHFHRKLTEDYYIISKDAKIKVIIDGKEHLLSTGDHIRILPLQVHQVVNLSSKDSFSLIVKCHPSWVYSDHNLVNHQ